MREGREGEGSGKSLRRKEKERECRRGIVLTFLIHSIAKTFHQVLVLGICRTTGSKRALEPRDVVDGGLGQRAERGDDLLVGFGEEESESHESIAASDD